MNMYKVFGRKNKKRKGFTLIELIVVIAILGILAAIAVPRVLGFETRASEQADKQTAVQIRNALALLHANDEIEFTDGGNYTITAGTNQATVSNITSNDSETVIDKVEELVAGAATGTGTSIVLVGDTNLVVTVQADGSVEVTSP